jgi:hypothetical protein
MINKNFDLLGEQLAESGLEMSIDPSLVLAGINAGTSLLGGIMGSSSANSSNKAAKKAYKKQKKAAKQSVRNTNNYNRQVWKVDQENYYKQRDFQYKTALATWKRQNEIQDFEYLNALKRYNKDLDIYSQNTKFAEQAAALANTNIEANLANTFKSQMFDREDQIATLKKALTEGAFNRQLTDLELESVVNKNITGKLNINQEIKNLTEQVDLKKQDNLVKSLQERGDAALRQAGKSRQKGMQSTLAQYYRDTAELSNMLSGKRKQAAIQLAELEANTATAVKQLGIKKKQIDNAMLEATYDAKFNLRVLDADLESAISQAERDIRAVDLEKYGKKLQAFANLGIRPERFAYAPKPEKAPERVFAPPFEADPDAAVPPSPAQQSTWGPLVSGVLGAATGFSSYYASKPGNVVADLSKVGSAAASGVYSHLSKFIE